MPTYSLTVENQSSQSGTFAIYQDLPDTNHPGMLRLAWLAKRAHPGTTITFNWTIDYCFVWSEQGSLTPGTTFKARQTVCQSVSPTGLNRIELNYDEGAFQFGSLSQLPGRNNSLYIFQTSNVPPRGGHVGIGMSGSGTFVVPTSPNLEVYFTPRPRYYLLFGDYEQGEVVDITEVSIVREVVFSGTYDMRLIFTSANMWETDNRTAPAGATRR